MKVHETLNMAADLIREHGWGQGSSTWGLDWESGNLCLEGGIAAAMGVSAVFDRSSFTACPAYKSVKTYLGEQLAALDAADGMGTDLYRWNDRSGRTAEEVIEVLRAAAVIEQAREESTVKQLVEVTA